MHTPDSLVRYVATGLGWEWCEDGACLVVYTQRGPIRVFVPLPNIWATFDRELVRVGLGEPKNVGNFSVGGLFDKIHRSGVRAANPYGQIGTPLTLDEWGRIGDVQRMAIRFNDLTPADQQQAIANGWGVRHGLFSNLGKAAKKGVSLAATAVKTAAKAVKQTAEKTARHAIAFVDKNLGFVPGVKQATALARKGLDFGNQLQRLAAKAAANPYVQAGLSAAVPGAAGAFAVYNAARMLERGNPLAAAAFIPGAGALVTQAASAIPAASSALRAARRGDMLGLARSASQFVPGPRLPARLQRFADVARMAPTTPAEIFASGQHAAQVFRTTPGAVDPRHAIAMMNAAGLRDAVRRQLLQRQWSR